MKTLLDSLMFYRGDIYPVRVEVYITAGIGIHIVGISDNETKETLLRVATALQAYGYRIPGKKIVIRIVPLLLKTINIGGNSAREEKLPPECAQGLDFAIALGILAASKQIKLPGRYDDLYFGKLALDGHLIRPFCGILDNDLIASILAWQLRRSYGIIYGFNVSTRVNWWKGYETLQDFIQNEC